MNFHASAEKSPCLCYNRMHEKGVTMHTFQPYPTDLLEVNPFMRFAKDWACLTAEKDGRVNAMTISWGGLGVMWGKNVATIYVRDSRYTKEFIDGSEFFSVSFLDENYRAAMKFLGTVSGRDEDKIEEARLHVDHSLNVPFIDEANLVFICHKMSATRLTPDMFLDQTIREKWYAGKDEGNMHTMYIGEVIHILAR